MADDTPTRRADADDYLTRAGLAAGHTVFGRYTLRKILGRGGMGVVWLAHDEELSREVALKFMPETVTADRGAVADLKRETRRALELTHPHIVRIYDFVSDAQTAAISMEYVAGDTLSGLRVDRPDRHFEVADLREWVRQLCEALDYAHAKAKVVHRDLKPANLMVDAKGDLKIADFGISSSVADSVSRLSARVGTSGTPVYMSPQQMLGEKPAPTDDIYALGATLYELLTGKPPFHSGRIETQVMQKVPPSLAERRAELEVTGQPIPAAWEETIQACLAKEPKQRPQSAGEVAARLGLAAAQAGARFLVEPELRAGSERGGKPTPPPPARVSGVATPSSPQSKARLYAALAVLIALGLGGWWLWDSFLPAQRLRAEQQVSKLKQAVAVPQGGGGPVAALPVELPKPAVPAALPREFTVTVDPADAMARLWLGPLSDVAVKEGRAVLKDLPDGEQNLTVQAPGYQPFTTRVMVKDGRGSVDVKLVAEAITSVRPSAAPAPPRPDYCTRSTYIAPNEAGTGVNGVAWVRWRLPPVVQPRQKIEGTVTWQFSKDTPGGGYNPNAVVNANVFGDWQPETELARLIDSALLGEPRTVEKTIRFRAPERPGRYRLRWMFITWYHPNTSFYGGRAIPRDNCSPVAWSEVSFEVAGQ